MKSSKIHHQVKLPLTVAFGVVMQGIKIRLGRSLVTLAGVVLGIAFLMSILTGQLIREGVSQETAVRQTLKRMQSFLLAETGPLEGRTLGVIQVGTLSSTEQRFLQALAQTGVSGFNWSPAKPPVLPGVNIKPSAQTDVGKDATAVLIIGDGNAPADADWSGMMAAARQRVVALCRTHMSLQPPAGIASVLLERTLTDEEQAKVGEEARKSAFRTTWIIIISLLVTVIGISNAMLMSVTERFREIGTMKCLGALSAFIRQLFFIESSLMGLIGSIVGSLVGSLFACAAFIFTYGTDLVLHALNPVSLLSYFLLCVVAGVVLSIIAAIYPASFASRMVPATALRSNI